MAIADFLSPPDVMVDVDVVDKAQLLRELSKRAAASTKLDRDTVSMAILKRESLGSTGTGGGIAIPHARFPGLKKPFGFLTRLKKAIDFDAIDDRPVDIVFLLLLSADREGEQLKALASVARSLRNSETVAGLRRAKDKLEAYRTITHN
jgi:nitrogen PTS system EIIA component